MPTKVQAKTAIDGAAVQVKADIDNILPASVNITDGEITFNPIHWILVLNAGRSIAAAETLATGIITNLTAASRPSTLTRFRRTDDGVRIFTIETALASYRITNF